MGKFKIGDRVVYSKNGARDDWYGKPATVTRVGSCGYDVYDVYFDEPHSGGHTHQGTGIPETSLLRLAVDVTKPLFIRNGFGAYPATLIGVLADGNIAVESADTKKVAAGYVVYDIEGKFVRSSFGGSATTLENAPEPVITKAYINIGSAGINGGKGLVHKPVGSYGKELGLATIEVTLTDGVVTDAKLIQPGNGKIKHEVVGA